MDQLQELGGELDVDQAAGVSLRSQSPLPGRSSSISWRISSTSTAVFFGSRARRRAVAIAASARAWNAGDEAQITRARVRASSSQVSASRA